MRRNIAVFKCFPLHTVVRCYIVCVEELHLAIILDATRGHNELCGRSSLSSLN